MQNSNKESLIKDANILFRIASKPSITGILTKTRGETHTKYRFIEQICQIVIADSYIHSEFRIGH